VIAEEFRYLAERPGPEVDVVEVAGRQGRVEREASRVSAVWLVLREDCQQRFEAFLIK